MLLSCYLAGSIGGGNFGVGGKGFGHMFTRVAIAGAIGGVASRVMGGDFWSGFQTGAFQRLFNDESHGDGYFATHAQAKAYAVRKAMGYDLPATTAAQKLEIASGTLSLLGFAFAPFKALSVAIEALSFGTAVGHSVATRDPSKLLTYFVGRGGAASVAGVLSRPAHIRYGITVEAIAGMPTPQRQ